MQISRNLKEYLLNFKNMRVLVTGGSSGIGKALAETLVKRNARVAICGRHFDSLEKVREKNPDIQVYRADVTIKDEIVSLKTQLDQDINGIDILINNAGRMVQFDIQKGIPESAKNEIELNFTAVLNLIDLFLPDLLVRKKSAIVNVSSGYALSPAKSAPVYCATKAALHSFTKSLRWQLEDTSVKVFEILPPAVQTPGVTVKGGMDPLEFSAEVIRQIEQEKSEVKIGQVRLLAVARHIAPWAVDMILKRRYTNHENIQDKNHQNAASLYNTRSADHGKICYGLAGSVSLCTTITATMLRHSCL